MKEIAYMGKDFFFLVSTKNIIFRIPIYNIKMNVYIYVQYSLLEHFLLIIVFLKTFFIIYFYNREKYMDKCFCKRK